MLVTGIRAGLSNAVCSAGLGDAEDSTMMWDGSLGQQRGAWRKWGVHKGPVVLAPILLSLLRVALIHCQDRTI